MMRSQQFAAEQCPHTSAGGGWISQGLPAGGVRRRRAAGTLHTVSPGLLLYPSGQVKLEQVGHGVVVTVVMMTSQHVATQQCPFAHTVSAGRLLYPSGQVKLEQVGGGVVVTVVTTLQHRLVQQAGS